MSITAEECATYQAIGKFIFAFSQLEFAIREAVASHAGIKDEHFLAIMSHDFALLCSIALNVLCDGVADDEERRDLQKIVSECRRLNDVRVKVAHGLWVPFLDGGRVWHVSRSSLTATMSVGQAKELDNYAGQVDQLIVRLKDWLWGE